MKRRRASDAPQKPIEKICTKTACDEKTARDSSDCSRCIDACIDASYGCDPSSACELNCGSRSTCSEEEQSRCVKQSVVVHLDTTSSPELLASCNRAFDRLGKCNLEVPGKTRAVCTTWAMVERPENAPYYDCVASKACNEDATPCDPSLTTTLGDEVCAALNAKLGSVVCRDEERQVLNDTAAWLQDDVIAVERACLALPDADEAFECHEAWKAAVGF